MTAALFDVAQPCARCGRGLDVEGSCRWCQGIEDGKAASARAMAATVRDPEWADRAARWLGDRPTGSRFTADDLVGELGLPVGSPNQVGATVRAWASAGIIEAAGAVTATRKSSHARLIRVWRVTE
jgi:hypothetical protein